MLKQLLGSIIILLIFAVIGFGMWNIGRTINYKLSYRGMVKETIREMVKKEALK